ncbi:MAG: capsule assembly Wzi family protein [Paludibacter sp.]|nr:capsule assembly Wzi family protein [Paludibacter sp.]
MHKYLKIIIILLFVSSQIKSQNDSIKYNVCLMGLYSTGEYSPFWLQNRQFGEISSLPSSADVMLGLDKEFSQPKSLFDYGFKTNILLQNDNLKTTVYFHEIYAKVRLSVFDLVIGSREENLGNQDSTLSCGGLFFSHNARPMPKITLGIERFTPVPFTKGFLEVKGALVHGWFTDNTYIQNMLLHHKYAYLRVGGKFPVHLQYGLDHVAQWGGYVPGLGQQPTSLKDYKVIFFAGHGGSNANISDQINALGNHIISQSTRLDVDISDYKISTYWQNLSEDGPIRIIYNSMNVSDGLWGISIKNKNFPYVKGFLYEYMNTTDQSGPYHDKDGIIYGGNDSYFNNGIYPTGWTYFTRTIGSPFFTSPIYNKNSEVYLLNNRVQVHHIGIEGEIEEFDYKFMTSYSKNYGSYSVPFAEMKPSTSLLLEINKRFPQFYNIEAGCSIGVDVGKMYGNSVGCLFSIKKIGDLFHY